MSAVSLRRLIFQCCYRLIILAWSHVSEFLNKLPALLERISLIEDKIRIQQYLDNSYKKEFEEVKSRQINKLKKIKILGMKAQVHYTPMKAIVNISKHQLITSEESVLNKDLNFNTTIKISEFLHLRDRLPFNLPNNIMYPKGILPSQLRL